MSNYDINSNPKLVEIWLSNLKTAEQQYCQENPDSLIPFFKKELGLRIKYLMGEEKTETEKVITWD